MATKMDFDTAHRKQDKGDERKGACVVLSYSVAAFPHTKRLHQDYLEAYCRKYKHQMIYLGQAEEVVAEKWNDDANNAGRNSYLHLRHVHDNANEQLFREARSKFTLTPVTGPNALELMKQALEHNPGTTAVLTLHPQTGAAHSIAVAYDPLARGYVISDPTHLAVEGPFQTFPTITDEAAHAPMGTGEALHFEPLALPSALTP